MTDENMTTCSCGGNNPDCFRCDGLGMIALSQQSQPRFRTSRPPHAEPIQTAMMNGRWDILQLPGDKVKSRKGRKQPRNNPCPFCGRRFRGAAGVLLHVKAKHGTEMPPIDSGR